MEASFFVIVARESCRWQSWTLSFHSCLLCRSMFTVSIVQVWSIAFTSLKAWLCARFCSSANYQTCMPPELFRWAAFKVIQSTSINLTLTGPKKIDQIARQIELHNMHKQCQNALPFIWQYLPESQFALKSIAHPLLMCPKYNTNVEIMTFKWLQPKDNNFLVGATVS